MGYMDGNYAILIPACTYHNYRRSMHRPSIHSARHTKRKQLPSTRNIDKTEAPAHPVLLFYLNVSVIDAVQYNGLFFLLHINPKIFQHGTELILCREAGIHQIAALALPFLESSIIEDLVFLINDKRHNVVLEALLEHN